MTDEPKIMTQEEYEEYVEELIRDGYILSDGTPLKCFCGCEDLYETGEYYDEHSLVEYEVKCKQCDARVGYYAYGYWEMP
jgi:hypothetical protein